MWRQILANPRDEWSIRVAVSDDEIIGFAMAGPSFGAVGQDLPRKRQLYSIYVTPTNYGIGVGRALLDESLGDAPAMLWVAKQNPRAIAFYVRNGFAFDGAEQIDPGARNITAARMAR